MNAYLPAEHTRPRPAHAAALTTLLTALAVAAADVPGGRILARSGQFNRIAVAKPAGERAALLISRTADGRPDPAVIAPVVAAILDHAPAAPVGDRSPTLDGSAVHAQSVMRRDNREPVRRRDGAWQWTVPGATIRVERHTITVNTPTAYLRIAFDGPRWSERSVAAVLDAALWQLADPAARHMTRTTAPVGWRRPTDTVPGAIGPDRTGGHAYSGRSSARCSCGETSTWDTRNAARSANKRHRADVARAVADTVGAGHRLTAKIVARKAWFAAVLARLTRHR
ncbi:hypothetical protein AB0D08_38265 [Kitasatospora sp. NPDC048540]|uniref:hypothetical protein n=1 Tax=Kitasatospora sp. NPDC048540 TaxID=3155634 RepID=UPI0033D61399